MFQIAHIARYREISSRILSDSFMANIYTKAPIRPLETFTSTDRQAELEP